jgi:signal transduction histidine kinase
MLVNGHAVGILCINYRRRHAFGEIEQHVLGLAAQLAAVALRNAEMNTLSAELAVKEERDRLIGQLHDSISQFVPAIQLMAETALKQWPIQPDQTAHWLERIQQAAHQALMEVRVNLFEAFASSAQHRNLRQALIESAKLVHEYFNIQVHLIPEEIPKQLHFPISEEIFLICREAIANAARHSAAQQITIDLYETDQKIHLHIQDDGCGFDLSALSRHGLRGLTIMRRRVERMAGRLNIHTQPGQGTLIEIDIPL